MIPADYGQITLLWGGVNYPHGAATTLGFYNPTAKSVGAIAANVGTALTAAAFGAMLSTGTTLVEYLVKLGPDDVGPSQLTAWNEIGANGVAASPAVAYLVHKATAFGGRKGRGRMYFPGVTEASVDGAGAVLNATRLALNGKLLAFYNSLVGNDVLPALLHQDALTPYPITTLLADATVATQRRRQRR